MLAMRPKWQIKNFTGALLLALVILLNGCGSGSIDPVSVVTDPKVAYKSALLDAAYATPVEVYTGLTPITNDNPDLIWENGVAGSRVLVTSWIRTRDSKWYDGTVDPACKPENCNVTVDLWVTVAPEIKKYFSGTTPTPLRVAQLLGVTPEYADEDRSFVEIWVSPLDLFRPCPDTEISDKECQPSSFPIKDTDFPSGMFWKFATNEKVNATEGGVWEFMDYKGWFKNRTEFIYSYSYPAASGVTSLPYPWTRLGYTYDWGNANHIGLSEYVVHGKKENKSAIQVGVKSIKATMEYFAQ